MKVLDQDVVLSVGVVLYRPSLEVLKLVLQSLSLALEDAKILAKCYLINNTPDSDSNVVLQTFVEELNLPFDIELMPNSSNTGYGAGNNLAIKQSKAKYHLVLNPDVFLSKSSLRNAIRYMDAHPQVVLLCPKVLNEDGSQQFVHRKNPTLLDMFLRSFAPRFLKKLFARRMDEFQLKQLDWSKPQNIESPSGCCMLFRNEILQKVGGFDESFFMYYEDSDIGRRIREMGQVTYFPDFEVTHLWARASHRSWGMRWIIVKSGLRYFLKWRELY